MVDSTLSKDIVTAQPLVSIITVVLNGEKYLEQAILSVLGQSYRNIEYIVIDGGSEDGSLDIIKKYEAEISSWISEPDEGVADAFNKGIDLSSGSIIGILNSDDWYESHAVESVVQQYHNKAVFCGNVQYWDGDVKDYVFSTNVQGLTKEMTVNHPAVFVTRNVYESYGVFNKRYIYAMDYELLLRFYKKGVEFVVIDSVISNMRLAGLSDENWSESFREVRQAKILHGEPRLYSYLYNAKQIIRRLVAYLFTSIGLEMVVGFYRRNHSIIKKSRR